MNVIEWLLDSDPALRWQVIRDLTGPDERMTEALDILESKRDNDGRWPMDHAYHDRLLVDLGETEGQPSRWITLRALRIMRWAGRDGAVASPESSAAST